MLTFKTEACCFVSNVCTAGKVPCTVKRMANTALPYSSLAGIHDTLCY